MKKFSFLSIIYYTVVVIIGVVLAFALFSTGVQVKISDTMKSRANSCDTLGVTKLITGFQNEKAIYDGKLEDGSYLGIYETVSTYTNNDNKILIEQSYTGILVKPSDVWQRNEYTDEDGKKYNKFGFLFDFSKDNNEEGSYFYRIGYMDNDSTLNEEEAKIIQNRFYSYEISEFYYFQIGSHLFEENSIKSLTSISLINNDGTSKAVSLDLTQYKMSLSFDESNTSEFMKDTKEFVNNYNSKVLAGASDKDLDNFTSEFVNNNYKYSKSDSNEVIKYVPLFNVLKLLAYTAIVIVLGDTLVGKHLLIILIMKLFGKKSSKEQNSDEYEFMNDYEVNTTFSAVVPNNYSKTITIKYVDETNNEVVFDLKKADNYSKTIKIKNGHYYHPEIISDGLICKDVPSNINVRGLTFKLNFEFETKNDIAE